MAYTEAQLQAQLANAQKKLDPNSVSGKATINRITNDLNALKASAPTTTSTPAATTPTVKTTTNQYDFTKTPAQNSGAGMKISTSATGGTVVGGTSSPKVVNSGVVPGTGVAGTTGVVVPAGAGGIAAPTGTPSGAVTPPAVTPTTPATYTLRDVATGAGMTIGNNGNIPLINGNQIDPAKAGLTLVDGHWQGTAPQIGGALGIPVELRSALEGTGRTVAWDPQTGRVTVNGIPIDTGSMVNIGGKYYTTQEGIDSIITRTGGNVPVGQDMRQIGENTGQGVVSGEQVPQDVTLKGQYEDSLQRIRDLEAQVNDISQIKVPEIDYTPITKIIEQMKNYTNVYDQQLGELVKSTLGSTFEYSPDNDPALQKAIKYADRTMMEQMNARGILSSSITEDNLRTIREELLPQYQALALEKYNQELNNNFKKVDMLQSLSNNDYERYKTFATLSIENINNITKNTIDTFEANLELMQNTLSNKVQLAQLEAQTQADTYKKAWDKFRELGYVDEETSLLTGLPVGMRSREAENEILARYDAYNKIALEYQMNREETDYQYQLDRQKLQETYKLNKQTAKEEEARKAEAGKVIASLGNLSAEKALNEISKNWTTLSQAMGSELYTVVDKLREQKAVDDKAREDRALEQQRIDVSRMNAETKQEKAASTMTTAEKNQFVADASKTYKSYPTKLAIQYLVEDAENGIIPYVGITGYKQIWDQTLGEAVKRGDKGAELFKNYFKRPENKTDLEKMAEAIGYTLPPELLK